MSPMSIWDCNHYRSEVRTQTNVAGNPMYGRMCLTCGRLVGTWLEKSAKYVSKGEWDFSISKNWMHSRAELSRTLYKSDPLTYGSARNASLAEDRRKLWFDKYSGYLASPEWKHIRQKVMSRAKGMCEGCGETQATQVHHKTYDRIGQEMLFDLVAICERCHNRIHGKQ